jgi:hypothetical protein
MTGYTVGLGTYGIYFYLKFHIIFIKKKSPPQKKDIKF